MAYAASVVAGAEPAPEPGPTPPPPEELADLLRARYARDRRRELERGLTLSGPHRDDVLLSLGALPARSHASHGEAWSLALALRLAAHRWLTAEGDPPILLLDDVFAELDRDRRRRLAAAAGQAEQVLVTAAVPEEVPAELRAARFAVEPGAVRRIDAANHPAAGASGPSATGASPSHDGDPVPATRPARPPLSGQSGTVRRETPESPEPPETSGSDGYT